MMKGVITGPDVPALLLAACPSFAEAWAVAEVENVDEEIPGKGLGYTDAGDFARHLVALFRAGETQECPAVFALIERMLLEGDEYVQGLAVMGYLEDLQNLASRGGLDPERDIKPWLLPRSVLWWEALNRQWGGEEVGALQHLREQLGDG